MGGTLWPTDLRLISLFLKKKLQWNIIKKKKNYNVYVQYIYFFIFLQDEYNLNPGLEWEDEFTGRYTLKNSAGNRHEAK